MPCTALRLTCATTLVPFAHSHPVAACGLSLQDGTHTFFMGDYSAYEKERIAVAGKETPKPRFRKIA
jgi:hypothetical protein